MRVVTVDDEPLALEAMRRLLTREPDVDLVGEARDAASAIAAIEGHRPDLVLLDVQMPDADGFEVLARIPPERWPAVVFVTAHGDRALEAFDVCAVDYVLKPVDPARLRVAIERVRTMLGSRAREGRNRLRRLIAMREGAVVIAGDSGEGYVQRFSVRAGADYEIIAGSDVRWISSAGNYVLLHAVNGDHLLRTTLGALERRLDPAHFARIHRTRIVNVWQVRKVTAVGHGGAEVVLRDGTRLGLGRRYREKLAGLVPE